MINQAMFSQSDLVMINVISIVVSLLLAAWVYRDARSRNINPGMWACVTFFCGCCGLCVYLINRSNQPIQQGQQPQFQNYGPNYQGGQYSQQRQPQDQRNDQYSQGYSQAPPPSFEPSTNRPSPFGQPTMRPQNVNMDAPPSEYDETTINSRSTVRPRTGGKTCKFCNSNAPENAKFCPVCGSDEFN